MDMSQDNERTRQECGQAPDFLCSSPTVCKDKKFQQVVYVNYRLEEFIYLLDVMKSVYDKVITNQPICNVL